MKSLIVFLLPIVCCGLINPCFAAEADAEGVDRMNAYATSQIVKNVSDPLFQTDQKACEEKTRNCVKACVYDLPGATEDVLNFQAKFEKAAAIVEAIRQNYKIEGKELDRGLYNSHMDLVLATFARVEQVEDFIGEATGKNPVLAVDRPNWDRLFRTLKEAEEQAKEMRIGGALKSCEGCLGVGSEVVVGTTRLTYPQIRWSGYCRTTAGCRCVREDFLKYPERFEFTTLFEVRTDYRIHKLKVPESNTAESEEKPASVRDKYNLDVSIPYFSVPERFSVHESSVQCCMEFDRSSLSEDDWEYYEETGWPDGKGGIVGGDDKDDDEKAEVEEEKTETEEEQEESQESSYIPSAVNEARPVSFPGSFLGVSTGIGYSKSDEELAFCAGAEYMYQLLEWENALWYMGGGATVDLSSLIRSEPKSLQTAIMVGPKTEFLFPLGDKPVAFTTGLNGGFAYGIDKFGDFKDKFTMGYLDLFVGLYLQCKRLDFALEAPLFSYKRIKYRDEALDFVEDEIDFLLNKRMPLKASLVIPFGEDRETIVK